MGKLSQCFSCFSNPSTPQEKPVTASHKLHVPSPAHFSTNPTHISSEHAHFSIEQHAPFSKKVAQVKAPVHDTEETRVAHISKEEPREVVIHAQVSKEKVAFSSRSRGNAREGRVAFSTTRAKAAVTIQAHFRSYLARRALRALKSLVKLQALVRGHISRKDMLHRVHSLLRVQARARAGRAQISDSPNSSAKSSQFCHPGPPTPEKTENIIRSNSARRDHSPLKRNCSRSTSRMINDQDKQQYDWYWSGRINAQKSEKIVEMDSVRSHLNNKRKNIFHATQLGLPSDQYSHSFSTSKDSTTHQTLASPSSYEVRSFSPMKVTPDVDESPFCTAHNSPQFYSASSRGSRKSLFTPTKSDGTRSYLSGYMDHPNYMACTESSKAKTRSVSAPRQRTQMERSGSVRRYLVYNSYEESKVSAPKGSAIHASFMNKAYPGSGRLDRLGLPVNAYVNGY